MPRVPTRNWHPEPAEYEHVLSRPCSIALPGCTCRSTQVYWLRAHRGKAGRWAGCCEHCLRIVSDHTRVREN